MKCPYCSGPDTRVLDSRQTEDGAVVRRRRICDNCGRRFTTYETAEASIVMVVKKDGRREAFDRNKVRNGLRRACEKRQVSTEEIEEISMEIERKIYSLGEKEVSSDYVGELVMDALREVDQVAYIRFASVYREFANVEKFAEEIDKLRQQSHTAPRQGDFVRVAIDGPSGAGKSTVARMVAQQLGWAYIDTGAMYRAIALKMKRMGLKAEETDELAEMLDRTTVDVSEKAILLDGKDVSGEIRTPEISEGASKCAELGMVRRKLVEVQQAIGHRKNVVMDGRDIGTRVFPDAQYKFFLTATAEERAMRRFKELHERGEDVDYETVLKDVKARDRRDSRRKLDPLRKADDAVEIDSTSISAQEAAEIILKQIRK